MLNDKLFFIDFIYETVLISIFLLWPSTRDVGKVFFEAEEAIVF